MAWYGMVDVLARSDPEPPRDEELERAHNAISRRWYDFNFRYFDGRLEPPGLLTVSRELEGAYIGEPGALNGYFDPSGGWNGSRCLGHLVIALPRAENDGTLLHEMIHQAQFQFREADRRHGEKFIVHANRIAELRGWPSIADEYEARYWGT